MDDKLKRELSAAVDRGANDPKVKKLIAGDAQARAYFHGLLAVDRALREWPAPSSDSPATDAFVDAVLARLDEPIRNDDFDPFAAPFADEREATKNPRQHTEQHEMSQSNDQDNEDDLEGLAALMRPSRTGSSASVPPPPVSMRPGPALADDAMDESSGIVDIKHLAAIAKRASVPPASEEAPKAEAKSEDKPAEKTAEAKSEAKSEKKDGDKSEKAAKPAEKKSEKSSAKTDEKKSADKSEKAAQAVPASTAASEPAAEKKGTSPVVWIAGIGLAAGIAFVAGRQGNNPTTSVNAEAPQSAAPAQSPVMTAGNAGAAPAAQPSVAAPTQPPAVTQPAAADPAANAQAQAQPQAAQPAAPTESANQPAVPARAEEGRAAPANAEPVAALAQGVAVGRAAPRAANDGAESERRAGAVALPTRTREAPSGSSGTAATSTGAATTTATTAPTTAARSTQGAQSALSGPAARGGSTASATTAANTGASASTTPAGSGGAAPGASRPLSVQELMDRATGRDRQQAAAAAAQQAAAAQAAALPPQLTRSMVQSTMSPFNSAVRACAQGQTGTATAILTVNGDGSVANVTVASPWGSGPNDCITNRLRTARFPAVQRPSSRVVYPFSVLAPQPGG